ncbi:hypothetical protein ACFWU3_08635 [Streptomyces sp. NPDC058685]|uniref:hypothetical protein n=1 Tax=Streptomyces sp. NPDC058685 TaxID=3346598 RepID=UPI00364E0080
MEMTESFATTAAAVAPLLWAIGTVEVQQVRKHLRSWIDEQERRYNEAVVAMTEASDEESLARARGRWERAQRGWVGSLPTLALYQLWACLSIAMCSCTIVALRWLSEDGGPGKVSGPDPGDAEFIFYALAGALLFITALPGWVVTSDLMGWREHRKSAGKALEHLDAQAQARVQARTADPSTDELPQP